MRESDVVKPTIDDLREVIRDLTKQRNEADKYNNWLEKEYECCIHRCNELRGELHALTGKVFD